MNSTPCPRCHTPIPSDGSQGHCPKCLFDLVLSRPELVLTGAAEPLPPPPTPAEIQPLFPQLEIVRLIGRGGMGAVYEARQLGLQRTVALKLLWTAPNPDAGFEERFAREGRALAQLAHDNVVAIHDAGRAGPYFWLLMEYVDGQNLRQVLQSGLIDPARALAIVMQMCAALEYAHQRGVVHRDVKPENVLFTRSGCVKIADFGLAKVMGRDRRDLSLTGSYQAMGTPHYMAPEQIERPKLVDHRADIYSLGVVLYEVLTGELPLGRFAMPSRKVRVDARLDDIVAKALQKEPDERYQAASEVSTAVGIVATPRPSVRPPPRRQATRSRGSWIPLAVVAASVLVAGVAVAKFDLLATLTGNRVLTPEEKLAQGTLLLTSSDSFLKGVAFLESAYAQAPELPELRPRLIAAMPRAVANLLSSGEPYKAVAMVRRLDAIDPSPGIDALVASTEAQGRAALAKALSIVSPGPGEILKTRRVRVAGQVGAELNGAGISVNGTPVLVLDSAFDHEFAAGADGRQTLEVKVTQGSGLELALPREFVVDTQRPTLVVSYPQPGAFVPATFDVLGTVVDDTPVVVAVGSEQLPGQDSGDWTCSVSLGAGKRNLVVKAVDACGLAAEHSIPVVVDAKGPVIDDRGQGFELVSARDRAVTSYRVSDDSGIRLVRWNGDKATVDAAGNVKIVADLPDVDGVTVPMVLEAVDLAGNATTVSVSTRRDRKEPVLEYQRQEEAVFAGETYTLVVACDDDSKCILVHEGKEHGTVHGEDFSVPVVIPADRQAGETIALTFVVRDAADNRVDGRKVLLVAPRCASCQGSKACAECEGAGNVLGNCRKCKGGTNKVTCDQCAGDGKSACLACGGSGDGQQTDCWRCDRGRLSCDGCNGSGVKVGPCPMLYCDNGIRRDFPYANKRCPTCKGNDRYESTCGKCSGKKSVACDESGCRNGMSTLPCGACKNGRIPTPCSLCEGAKTLAVKCADCNEDGQKTSKCRKCSGSSTCPTCRGSGRADRIGTQDPASEVKSDSGPSRPGTEQAKSVPTDVKADADVLARFPIGSRWSGVHYQDGRTMPSTAVVIGCAGTTVTLEVHNGGQALRHYELACAGETVTMVKNTAHGTKADGSAPSRLEPVSVVGTVRPGVLSMEGVVKVWSPDGVQVGDVRLRFELTRSASAPPARRGEDSTSRDEAIAPPEAFESPQLLKNPGCEEPLDGAGIPGWQTVQGGWQNRSTEPAAHEGQYYFFATPSDVAELQQTVALAPYRKDVQSGDARVHFQCRLRGWKNPHDTAEAVIEIADAAGTVLTSNSSGERNSTREWELYSESVEVPANASSVTVRLISRRREGKNNDGYFDDLSLVVTRG